MRLLPELPEAAAALADNESDNAADNNASEEAPPLALTTVWSAVEFDGYRAAFERGLGDGAGADADEYDNEHDDKDKHRDETDGAQDKNKDDATPGSGGRPWAVGERLGWAKHAGTQRTASAPRPYSSGDVVSIFERKGIGRPSTYASIVDRLEAKGYITTDAAAWEAWTADLPPLDLLIRTGGERRLSNFLLWQAAYAELYFTPALWPDFDGDALDAALEDYAGRQRRFGRSGEQVDAPDGEQEC